LLPMIHRSNQLQQAPTRIVSKHQVFKEPARRAA
jgi:hypothetical protein